MAHTADTVGVKSTEFQEQASWLHVTRTLLGGTRAMREAGKTYLPMKQAEDIKSYENRKDTAVLLNYYQATGGYLTGLVFQKQVDYQAQADEAKDPTEERKFFDQFKENVNGQGANLSNFTSDVFRAGVDDGVTFILADYSAVEMETDEEGNHLLVDPDGTRKPLTAAMTGTMNLRPYWVQIKADAVLDCVVEVVQGVQKVTEFRYEEETHRYVDDELVTVRQVRVFYPGVFELWEQVGSEGFLRRQEGFLRDAKGNLLDFVPVTWFMPGKPVSEVTAHPALEDLAWMNVSHWQAYSEHQQLMAWMRAPVWFGKKLRNAPGEDIEFGAGRLVNAEDEGASLESVGVNPASVEKSFEDLKSKVEYMSQYGLQVVSSTSNNLTATQAEFIAGSSESQLKEWVQALSDTMENALRHIARWMGYADGPALSINTEFRLSLNVNMLTFLSSMKDKGQLSTQTLLTTLKHMGVFSDEFKVEDELVLISKELEDYDKRQLSFGDYSVGA